MSHPAAGLHHAIERLRRWRTASRTMSWRKRSHARQRFARELDAVGAELLDLWRLPPPASLSPERRSRP